MDPIKRKQKWDFLRINSISKYKFGLFLCIAYPLIVGFGMFHHEMWRDELEWFLRIKYQHMLAGGDPCYIIYNAFLYLFSLLDPSEWMFQLAHLVIIFAAVCLISLLSPFSNLEKFLIIFGYYIAYEYSVISRYYGFIVLIVFLVCYLIGRDKPYYSTIVLLLLILADHNPSATILSASLSLYLVLDVYNKILSKKESLRDKNIIIAAVLLVLGWAALLITFKLLLFKAYGSAVYKGGTPPLFTVVNAIWNSYVPIPDLTQHVRFWWTNILPFQVAYPQNYHFTLSEVTWSDALAFGLSLLIFLIVISKFRKKPIILTIFLINSVIYGVFMQCALKAYTSRYLGLQFITLIYCYWLFQSSGQRCNIGVINQVVRLLNRGWINQVLNFFERYFKPALYFFLAAGAFATCVAYSKELNYKFSLSRDAANYIKWMGLQDTHILVGYPDYAAQCISAHLDKPIFYPQIGSESYYSGCLQKNFKQSIPLSDVAASCTKFTEKENKKVLLILNFPIMADENNVLAGPAMISKNSSIQLLQAITGEVINPDEQFWLYEVTKVQ